MPVFNTPHARLAYRLSRLLRLTTTLSTRRLSRDGVSNKRGMNLFEAGERTDIEDDGHTALPWRGPWQPNRCLKQVLAVDHANLKSA